jgi:hypothetical protein
MTNSDEPAFIISPQGAEHEAPAQRGSAQSGRAPIEPVAAAKPQRRSPQPHRQASSRTPETVDKASPAEPEATVSLLAPETATTRPPSPPDPIRQARVCPPETAGPGTPVEPEAAARFESPETAEALSPSPPEAIQQAITPSPETASPHAPAEPGAMVSAVAPETAIAAAPSSPEWICAELVALQKRRRFAIRMQSRIDRGLQSVLATQLGYHTRLPSAERLRLFRRAAVIRASIVNDDPLVELSDDERRVANIWRSVIITTEQSRGGWDLLRADVERSMERLAIELPVWQWASIVRGFSPLGLAAIVGESCGVSAATPAEYRSHQNLCKRLGLGVVDGVRQGAPGAGATPEDWIRHGYKRDRRAEVWTFLDLGIRNAQYRREGPALGAYGALYARQVEVYEERGWRHARPAAGRYMAKCFIRDLWRAWRHVESLAGGAAKDMSPQGQVVAAAPGEAPVG